MSHFAVENDVTQWETFVLDEPLSNLQEEENREAALDYITGLDRQLIVTTSNEDFESEFSKIEILERAPLQTTLGDFL